MTTPLAAKIAREYGTPVAVIDMDRVERNIARIQAACDAAGVANRPHIKTHKSPMLARMQIEAGARGITCQKLGEAEVMAKAGHRRHPDQLQSDRRGENGAARRAAGQGQHDRRRRQFDRDRRPAAGGRGFRPAALGGGRMRHRPQARRRRNPGGSHRAGARDRGVEGIAVRGLHAVPDRDRLGGGAEILRRGAGRRARARARCGDGLDRRHAEPEERRQTQGRHRASARHLYLQRPHAGRRRRRQLGRLRAEHLFDRGQPRRSRSRHSRCRLEDADLGYRRRARRPRPDPRTSRSQNRALRRGAWLSRSRPAATPAPMSATSCGSCPTMSASSST